MSWRAAPDAKYWRHLWSVQLNIIGAAFAGIASIVTVFTNMQWVTNHPFAFAGIVALINILALGGRLLDQPDVPNV